MEFGLTGGIGSGKSTVARLLVARGAVLIDADAIVRGLQRPGELVFDAMVDRWGQKIVAEDGTLDRAAVAGIVFSDDDELTALNEIVHPVVATETAAIVEAASGSDAAVIHDIPLLVKPGGELLSRGSVEHWGGIIVVDTPVDLAIARVVASRGMQPDDVQARIDSQATREERRAVADFVIDNAGDLRQLEAEVDRCWQWIEQEMAA